MEDHKRKSQTIHCHLQAAVPARREMNRDIVVGSFLVGKQVHCAVSAPLRGATRREIYSEHGRKLNCDEHGFDRGLSCRPSVETWSILERHGRKRVFELPYAEFFHAVPPLTMFGSLAFFFFFLLFCSFVAHGGSRLFNGQRFL